jgi:hypothetical protein
MPDGSFSYNPTERTGDWTILHLPATEHHFKLTGSLKFPPHIIELPSGITALVNNVKLPGHSFTGSIVEKVTCTIGPNTGKDDPAVFKGVKQTAYVRNVEYRIA